MAEQSQERSPVEKEVINKRLPTEVRLSFARYNHNGFAARDNVSVNNLTGLYMCMPVTVTSYNI